MSMGRFLITKKAAATYVFFAAAAMILFAYQSILQFAGDYLIISDNLKPADIIHVIAGEDHRTLYGIKLYRYGLAKQLFFTGGWCDIHREYHGKRAKRMAIRSGLSETAIVADDTNVTSTYAEAVRLKLFIENQPKDISSVIVVSDSYHMRRAMWTYRKVLGDNIEIQMAPVPFQLSPYARQWWRQEETFLFVMHEYIKIPFYYMRYQFSSGRLRDWLAQFDKY